MSSGSSWLFRQGDLILGPITTTQLIDKLFTGELNGAAEIQLMGAREFRKIENIPELKVHLAKAQAKLRVDAQSAAHKAKVKRRSMIMVIAGGGIAVSLAIVLALVGRYLAVHSDIDEGNYEAEITVDPPVIGAARRSGSDEELEYRGGGKRPGLAVKTPTGAPNPAQTPGGKPKPGSTEPDGLQMGEVDTDAVNAVVAAHKKTLFPCLKKVAQKGTELKVPIEFGIAETGKVTKLWIDNAALKDSPLQECMMAELQKWPFKPGPSSTSVRLSFTIK